MKFTVIRSDFRKGKPCEGASRAKLTRIDYRTMPLDQVKEKGWGEKWLKEGTNHREITVRREVWSVREVKEPVWLIVIRGLNELLKLREKYGEITIAKSEFKEAKAEIIIEGNH